MRPRNRNCSISNQSLFVFSVLVHTIRGAISMRCYLGPPAQVTGETALHCDSKGAGMFDHVPRSFRYDNGRVIVLDDARTIPDPSSWSPWPVKYVAGRDPFTIDVGVPVRLLSRLSLSRRLPRYSLASVSLAIHS